MRLIVDFNCSDASAFGFTAVRSGVGMAVGAAIGARVVVTFPL